MHISLSFVPFKMKQSAMLRAGANTTQHRFKLQMVRQRLHLAQRILVGHGQICALYFKVSITRTTRNCTLHGGMHCGVHCIQVCLCVRARARACVLSGWMWVCGCWCDYEFMGIGAAGLSDNIGSVGQNAGWQFVSRQKQ